MTLRIGIDVGGTFTDFALMDEGEIIEQNSPVEFFENPKHDRTKLFLSQILHH